LRRVVVVLTTAAFFVGASDPGMASAPFVNKRCTARERARFPERREQAVVKGSVQTMDVNRVLGEWTLRAPRRRAHRIAD